ANLPLLKDGSVDFSRDFFGQETFLTVSGQLNVEAFALAMSKVYTSGPTFRAEHSHTTRHLAEFWMIEPEIAVAGLDDIARISEGCLKCRCRAGLAGGEDVMASGAERVRKGAVRRREACGSAPLGRSGLSGAVHLLQKSGQKFGCPVEWGLDLQTVHER